MFAPGEGGGGVHEDDGEAVAGIVGDVVVGHVGTAAVMEGAVAGLQRQGDAFLPLQLGAQTEETAGVAQVLGGKLGVAVGPGDESHAAALDRHLVEGDPAGQRLRGIGVRPVGLILVKVGGGVVVRHLDQQVVVPKAQGRAGELVGDGGNVRVQGEALQRIALAPGVDELVEDVAVALAVLGALVDLGGRSAEKNDFLGGEHALQADEAVLAVQRDLGIGEGVGGGLVSRGSFEPGSHKPEYSRSSAKLLAPEKEKLE